MRIEAIGNAILYRADCRDPMPLAEHSGRLEWCGPLVPANDLN